MYNYIQVSPENVKYYPIIEPDEVPSGERIFLEIGKAKIALFNIAGKFYAIEDVCSHDDGPVGEGEVEGTEIICPRHGARFDLVTGKALAMPAIEDIPAYPVRVQNGMIEIGIPN